MQPVSGTLKVLLKQDGMRRYSEVRLYSKEGRFKSVEIEDRADAKMFDLSAAALAENVNNSYGDNFNVEDVVRLARQGYKDALNSLQNK